MTHVTLWPRPGFESFWNRLEAEIHSFAATYYKVRRSALSSQFNIILDRYYEELRLYEANPQGKRPKLAALAREAGVKIDSLRQAKFRRDHGKS